MNQLPIKSPDESVMSFPSRHHFAMLSQLIARGIKLVLCESTGRELLEACTWFPLPSLHFPFPLLIFLSILLLYLSCEYDLMMNLGSSPSKSPKLGVVLGAPDTP